MKICYIKSKETTGVEYHRIEVPFANLNDDYKDLDIVGCDGFNLEFMPTQFDVIVLNRVTRQDKDYIKLAKENGVKIILDLDDWIEWPEWHLNRDGFLTPQIESRIKEYVELSDVIWCASEYLLRKMYNAKCITIPNAIDFTQPQFIPQPRDNDKYTIGYVAGANHHKDIELLYHGIDKLRSQNNYDLLVAGYSTLEQSKSYWDWVTYMFTSGGKFDNKRFKKIEYLDCYNYAFVYNLIDVCLAPLADNEWSKCKSNIKILEAGSFGLPIICSNIEPYKEFIELGLVYTSEGWHKRLKDLIKNPRKGRLLGQSLQKYVKENYDIKKINKLRYESIINL